MYTKYRIIVDGETEEQDVEFNFRTNVDLRFHDVIVLGENSFFLLEKLSPNTFKAVKVNSTVNAF